MKKGLVLEGGAMRGMFTSGILDVMMENKISVDGAIGVSAGATFGCNFKSGQIGRAVRYNKRFAGDKRYCSFSSLIKTGDIYNADFCYNKIPNELDIFDVDSYRKNPMEFYIAATDVLTGNSVYKKLETCDAHDLEWMRASASMPLVSRPVKVDGFTLLDGGISDSIPLKYFESIGYKKNIVILTQPKNYVKTKNSLFWMMKIFLRKYPELLKTIKNRHIMYNEETEYVFSKAKEGNTLVLCPEESLGISRTEKNPQELERVYQAGRRLASSRLAEIKEFLA